MTANDLTAARLRELFNYDQSTGAFTRRAATNRHAAGPVATGPNDDGYLRLYIDGKRYKQHRLAFLYVHGKWPDGLIDHKLGDRSANAIHLIRDVDNHVNAQNRRGPNKNNKVGLIGASPLVRKNGAVVYRAQICVRGRVKQLGIFATPLEAHETYLLAKRREHPGYIAKAAIVRRVEGLA